MARARGRAGLGRHHRGDGRGDICVRQARKPSSIARPAFAAAIAAFAERGKLAAELTCQPRRRFLGEFADRRGVRADSERARGPRIAYDIRRHVQLTRLSFNDHGLLIARRFGSFERRNRASVFPPFFRTSLRSSFSSFFGPARRVASLLPSPTHGELFPRRLRNRPARSCSPSLGRPAPRAPCSSPPAGAPGFSSAPCWTGGPSCSCWGVSSAGGACVLRAVFLRRAGLVLRAVFLRLEELRLLSELLRPAASCFRSEVLRLEAPVLPSRFLRWAGFRRSFAASSAGGSSSSFGGFFGQWGLAPPSRLLRSEASAFFCRFFRGRPLAFLRGFCCAASRPCEPPARGTAAILTPPARPPWRSRRTRAPRAAL